MMETTVSAAFLMFLATCACTAQQDFWSPRLRLQPLWAFQDQPQSQQWPNSGGGTQGNQAQNPSIQTRGGQTQSNSNQNQGGQSIQWAQSPTTTNGAGPGQQNHYYQPQGSQKPSSGPAAAGYGANGEFVNAPGGQQPSRTKSTVSPIWNTPDHSASTAPNRAPEASRPQATYRPEAPSEGTTPSKRWPMKQTKLPSLGAVAEAARRPQPRPTQVAASAPPVTPEDKIVFHPPGGSSPGSMFNALEVAEQPDEATDNADSGPDSAMNINNGLRQFALDMLMDMTESAPNKNVVLSPYSIWAVMLVIYEGAGGQTAKQIAKTLKFKDKKHKVRLNYKRLEYALQKANNESHSDFVSGNGIFYDGKRPPMPDFEKFALNDYQCTLQPVDFSKPLTAVKVINDWVADVTRNRIKMLVKQEDIVRPELIITNALFFKGQWKIPFNLTATHTDKFYNEKKQHISDVRMMYQKGEYMYSFITEIGAHVLDMPYEDSKFRMLVVLPKPASTVAEVLRLMKQFPVDQCYERLVHEQEMFAEDEVHVYLPRFRFGNRVELRPNLERLGITDVFDSVKANLSSMSHLKLFLGKVFHVSEIEVNEEGTVASAATAGGFVNKMGPPKFLANRPFAYFIVENSQKTVIFAGKVADPNQKSY